MWSKGTDMAQADTPAFALHLWTRVQPLVSVEQVAKFGACKPWETVALACLWLAAKHEEARRALPPASRYILACPLKSLSMRSGIHNTQTARSDTQAELSVYLVCPCLSCLYPVRLQHQDTAVAGCLNDVDDWSAVCQ